MKSFRKAVFWLHLAAGILAGIFIFIMCVTGALLSFQPNMLRFAEREMRVVEPPTEPANRLTVNEILAKITESKPNAKASNIALQNDKTAAFVVGLGRDGQVFVNPYTGEITGEGAKNWRGFFRTVEDTHRWLALPGEGRAVGKSINDAANLLFLLLAISGVYIWFPRRIRWQNLKSVLWFRRGLSGRARDFNWHNTIGFWTSLVLIILTITGAIISYQWAGNLVYTLTGNEVPATAAAPPQSEQAFVVPENLNEMFAKAENYTDWKSISLRLPIAKDAAVFTIEEGVYWNIFARSTLTVDVKTGEIVKWESYGEQNSGRQLRSWARFTHTGETGGFVGQLIGFLACIGGAFLVWTGFSLAWRRFRGWLGKSKNDFES